LITTDTALSEDEIVRLYGKRWDIEVFFKVIKSYLKLAKEWQSRSYDAMVAHTTIVFSRYIMLAVEQRRGADSRSAGGIFYDCCEELVGLQFSQALALVMNCLRQVLQTFSFMTEADFSVLWQRFIESLPSILKERLAFSRCET
jgi:coproporphyrinogen III oxidase